MNYPDKPVPAGSQLVREVARSLPKVSDDGKTYTVTIRRGVRFSPPSNEPVTAQTFKYTIERSLSPKFPGYGPESDRAYLKDVVGEQDCVRAKAAHIAGVTARGNTLTIRLTQAHGDLPARLTMPFFCAVPLGTPITPKGVPMVPSAGPYYIASYTPSQQIVLKRNPNYHGNRPRRLEQIVYSLGASSPRELAMVKAGQADYDLDLAPEAKAELAARYGPGSAAAKAGRQQYFANQIAGIRFLVLNTSRPLFADVKLRKAVAYALDRRALLAHFTGSGALLDHYLPPGVAGHEDVWGAKTRARGTSG